MTTHHQRPRPGESVPEGRSQARRRRAPRGTVALLLAIALPACSDLAGDSPLSNARTSKEAVVREVFRALEARDTAAIRGLLVTREEFESLMWPAMPDRDQMPIDFSWSLKQTSRSKGLRQLMDALGGARLELESFHWTREPEVYPDFTIHKGARVVARDRDTGRAGEVATFDVLVEYAGGWKLLDLDEL